MATNRLTDNDIASLAQVFDIGLEYYCEHTSPLEGEYIKKLSTIMGLGFTSILVDGDLLTIYKSRLQTFMNYRNFKEHPGHIHMLSRAIAEVISEAVYLFNLIKYPSYYGSFVTAVESVMNHVIVQEAGKLEEANRLTKLLFKKPY